MATRRLGRGTRRSEEDSAPEGGKRYLTAQERAETKISERKGKDADRKANMAAALEAQGQSPEDARRIAEKNDGKRGGKTITALRALAQKGRDKGAREDAVIKDELSLGGSRAIQEESVDEARQGARESRGVRRTAAEDLDFQQDVTRDREAQFADEYGQSRTDLRGDIGAQRGNIGNIGAGVDQAVNTLGTGAATAAGILGRAAATNRLTGTTDTILGQQTAGMENVLAQRAAAMAANPSYAQLANQAIAAQTQGVQNQTNFAQGQLARRAMGAAAGMGEGGALGAQQAISSLVGAGGDMSMAANLADQQNAAAMRAQAAMAQRGETVGEADYASQARLGDVGAAGQARLGAAGTERATDLSTAQQQAGLISGASVGQAGLQSGKAIQVQNALQGLTGTGQAATNTAGSMQQGAGTLAGGLTKTESDAAAADKATELKTQTDLLVGTANANAAAEAAKPKRGIFGRRK